MSELTPKRVILRCPGQYFQDQGAMVTAFFDSQDLQPPKNYFSHILDDPSSHSKLYLVLDLHHKEIPSVDLNKLELHVFKVSKRNELYVVSAF